MRGPALALAWVALLGAGAPARPQDAPKPAAPVKSKPLSKSQQKSFADDLGWWLRMGDEPKLADSDKRVKRLADLKKLEGFNWKGVRKAWNGWITGGPPSRERKTRTELTYKYNAAETEVNEIYFGEPSGYRPGVPTPLCLSLHGGGRGQGNGSQAFGSYGAPFRSKGCLLFAPTVPGAKLIFANPLAEKFIRNFIHELQWDYSIDFDRCYAVGHSEGGVGAWGMAARMPDFWAACVAGAGNPPGILDYEYLYNTSLWVHHGSNDIQVPPTWDQDAEKACQAISPPLRDVHFTWYVATDGRGHGYPAWVPEKYEPWALERKRDMYPERVVCCCPIARAKDIHGIIDYDGSETAWDTFWVGIRGLSGGQGKVIATRKENRIEVTSTGVTNVVIYVSDEFLDLDKPVVVVVNGQERHNAIVPRSAEFLCTHIARTDDRGRFFSGEIVIPASQ